MYLPAHFRQDDLAALHVAIRACPLGLLISLGADGLLASHLPMLFDPEPAPYGTLLCHLARANVQWQTIEDGESLVVFGGPQAYVTPASYAAKAETGRVVPTWNYVSVQARGRARTFTDADRLYALVARLTDVHEAAREQPWSAADAPERFMSEQLLGIVGIEIPLREIRGKWKLSQNRSNADRQRIVDDLNRSDDPQARATAAAMEPFLHGPAER